jgi:hypothetical protein
MQLKRALLANCAATVVAAILALGAQSASATPGANTTYGYDSLGRLTLVVIDNGGTNGMTTITYSYDAAGNRTQQVSTTGTDGTPTATADSIVTAISTPVTFDPRINDTDPNNQTLTITTTGAASHGAVAITGGTTLTYTPTTSYTGSDSFTYTISNGHNSATATVTASVYANPVAVNDSVSTTENAAVTYNPRSNDSDPNSFGLTIVGVGSPANGIVAIVSGTSLTYTPASNYAGTDSFTYTISNGHGGTATATDTITITPSTPPVANNDTIIVPENMFLSFDPRANDTSPGGYALTITSASAPSHGTVVNYGGTSLTYTPTGSYLGADSFTYIINNGHGGAASATVNITVAAPPVANNDAVTTAQSTAVSFDPRTNDTDPNSYALTVSATSPPANGTATVNTGGTGVTYTPMTGFIGTDTFTYSITDGHGGGATATDTITVNATSAPIAGAASATVAYASTSNPITLNFTGGTAASVAVSTAAGHGTATASGTSITYTPTSTYSGSDSFQYTGTNSIGTSSPATVSITVTPQVPSVGAVSATFGVSSVSNPVTLSLSGGTAASVSVYTAASHGTATASGTTITYSPTGSYSGSDSFQYKATNAGGTSSAATVSVTVSSSAPVAIAQSFSTTDALTKTWSITGDSSSLSYTLSLVSMTTPTLGTITLNGGLSFTYVPNGNDGTDTFTYTISDGHGGYSTQVITVTVTAGGCHYC